MKYYITIIAIVLLAACGNQAIDIFDAPASLYFFRGDRNSAGQPQRDSINYSFFLAGGSAVEDTLWLEARLTGLPLPVARPFALVQTNVADSAAAVAGRHYVSFDDPALAAGVNMPADATSAIMPLIVKRTTDMDTASYRLVIAIDPGEHFAAGIINRDTLVIHITAMAVKPAAWDRYYDLAFGTWGQEKMRFLIDHVGYTAFDESLLNNDMRIFLNLKARAKLAEYEAVNGPLYELDGITQVTFP
ncbi:MAG: DUF4843 domain-containing protein [Odoribacteraceae bacterium]|jgi:hypothetical protein|nr:DUF4843 domain-containing protein [Odoribacteraceae bacterium]